MLKASRRVSTYSPKNIIQTFWRFTNKYRTITSK